MGDMSGLSIPAPLIVRNGSIGLFEVPNRGSPHLHAASIVDFLRLEEASTRGSLHFHTVLFDRAALADYRGDHIVMRALAPKNYPETSGENGPKIVGGAAGQGGEGAPCTKAQEPQQLS